MHEQNNKPWKTLNDLIDSGETLAIDQFLESLPPGEATRVISRLRPEVRSQLLRSHPAEWSAGLIDEWPPSQAADALQELPTSDAAAILQELRSDEKADIIAQVPNEIARTILAEMAPSDARRLRQLSNYPPDVAGGLMVTEFLAYDERASVSDVVRDLRDRAERRIENDAQYAYVTSGDRWLVGVLRLRDLLLAKKATLIRDIMVKGAAHFRSLTPLDEMHDTFEHHAFFAIPVVDDSDRLQGVVLRSSVERALESRSQSERLKSQGIMSGEELRTMPLLLRSMRRLAWLSINIVLNIMAASVIAFHEDTLSSVIALAVFLPIISDMSGCSGNQAVAVSMREISLGLVRAADIGRVLWNEIRLGLLNGLVLGLMAGLGGYLWKGNAYLGLVIGVALCLNTVLAVCLGGILPLLVKKMKFDPALASGPILTTITDMCGFLLVLSLASTVLKKLT